METFSSTERLIGTRQEDGDSMISDEEVKTYRHQPRHFFLCQDRKHSAIQVLWLVLWTMVVFGVGVATSRALFQEHRERVFSTCNSNPVCCQKSSQ